MNWQKPLVALFLGILTSYSLQAGSPSVASQSAAAALARAQNREYQELKALGPNPTNEQVRGMRNKVYAEADVAIAKALDEKMVNGFVQSLVARKQVISKIKQLKEKKGPGAKGLAKGSAKDKSAPNKSAEESAPVIRSRGIATNTGAAEGDAGAAKVEYGGARAKDDKSAPVVLDGIIQDR